MKDTDKPIKIGKKPELYDWSGNKAAKDMAELNRMLDRAREATDRGRRGQ